MALMTTVQSHSQSGRCMRVLAQVAGSWILQEWMMTSKRHEKADLVMHALAKSLS